MKTYTAPIFKPIRLGAAGYSTGCKNGTISTDESCRVTTDTGETVFLQGHCDVEYICPEVPYNDHNIFES